MKKFVVRRGRDAFLVEEAIVEAKDAKDAEHLANWRVSSQPLSWSSTGEVRTFDDTIVLEDEAEELTDDNHPEPMQILAVNASEFATILAALRFYQEEEMGNPDNRSDAIHDIATDNDVISLDDEGIDALCERLNA